MSTIETNDKGQDFAVSTTGGKKQKKLARYDLIPAGPLLELAELYGRGAAKYADRNWENGYDWSLSFSALQRHAWQFWDGENFDEETGAAHLASVAWHALALLQFMQQQKYAQFDDRPHTEAIVQDDVHEAHVHVEPDPVATSPEPVTPEVGAIQVGDLVQADPSYMWFSDDCFEVGVDYRVESKTLDADAGGGAYVTIAGRAGGWDASRFRKASASAPEPHQEPRQWDHLRDIPKDVKKVRDDDGDIVTQTRPGWWAYDPSPGFVGSEARYMMTYGPYAEIQ
ncbi:hypothetical protein SEA_APHELION_144 [Gordonia phage Aphelion]|uniref:dATP/dGTP diphosphohydrolase N-terminal domain-containing protein n=1 Tax=Gordonia phage Aphelion TaxID=2507860 RepID=A0A410TDB4_9CAUD|nr:hypothetical protein SEA_APHELION_144 [Gordonia phage Aphelion]WKW85942.1 hypothetical protein SEA_PHINKBODEN_143 [Gordonia Phage PhinkBoden]